MADVFVSYKREDAARVKKLVAALREVGLDAWWDEDIAPSAPWEATIEKALRESKAVIVCWSPDAVASENVRSEARVAREDGRLIQVFMKPCSPPLFFGERQGVDLSSWRGKADDPKIAKIVESVRAVAAGKKPHAAAAPVRPWLNTPVHIAIAALVVLAGSLAGWWLLTPAKAQGPQTLAVLPFRALNSADANLVDAIWDDTRGAISRNPNLRVLGPASVKALAEKNLEPADYRKRVGADYLLDGSVEHVGDRVQLKLSLTRTKDGAEVWNDEVGGKLDDVFAFQQRIANEVEGRIRGRVAPGGGAKPQNITTSAEGYALYAQARALILERGNAKGSGGEARQLLRKVVAMDPNFAPAWADLAQSLGYGANPDQTREALGYAQRALQLAPNLGHAHAVLAMVRGTPPEFEGELRKAIELDPGDQEAWSWLGNCLSQQNRLKDALAAYSRAVEIEPLFWPAIGNKINLLTTMNDSAALNSELARLEKLGDPIFISKAKAWISINTGHPADGIRRLLDLKLRHADQSGWIENHLGGALLALGFFDEASTVWSWPPDTSAQYRGDPGPPNLVKWGYDNRPKEFWQDKDAPALFGRLFAKHGRLKEYRQFYTASFKSPDELVAMYPAAQRFTTLAPTIAADLRAAGEVDAAQAILARADSMISNLLKNGPETTDISFQLAFLRAAEGNDDEAMTRLRRAFDAGWLPDRSFYATDIADEPAFAHLVNRPDFQALRKRILARIEEERRKVPLDLLHRAYPVPTNTKQIAA